jgi:tRNA modification GTPase
MNRNPFADDTIVALATPQGSGAIAVIRLSGKDSIQLCDTVFRPKKKKTKTLSQAKGYTLHFGEVMDNDLVLDEVIVSVFQAPHSYTSENSIEISCHGSVFIQQQIILLLIRHGARLANPGEFTLRAFLKGRIDLSQAEAVADLIASNSSTSHQVAMQQMRGGFSSRIKVLRENLINFASLIELELDFGEEDVEFANRDDLKKLILSIQAILHRLIESFEVGNVIKNGIPVAIVGKPNTGKSTLLNVLLDEERAIVSEIPGTTRDTIEDEITIDGVLFRFIDTAGIRKTTDAIESIGVSRTWDKIRLSSIVLYVFDVHEITPSELRIIVAEIRENLQNASLLIVGNKIDKEDINYTIKEFKDFGDIIFISAKEHLYIDDLRAKLVALFDNKAVNVSETIVTNARHVQALQHTNSALTKVFEGLNSNISGELLSIEIRTALQHLGEITGEITNDNLLENIFSKFCIGK